MRPSQPTLRMSGRSLKAGATLPRACDRLWEIFCQEKESRVSKEYQIEKAQAEEEFAQWAKENGQPVQLSFATAEVVRLAQQGLGELLVQVGRQVIEGVKEAQ